MPYLWIPLPALRKAVVPAVEFATMQDAASVWECVVERARACFCICLTAPSLLPCLDTAHPTLLDPFSQEPTAS